MTARQQLLSARVPRYAALYFPEENTTGISPVSNILSGLIEKDRTVECTWNESTVSATIIQLSNSRAELSEAIDKYEPAHSHTEPTPVHTETALEVPVSSGPVAKSKTKKKEGPTAKAIASGCAAPSKTVPSSATLYRTFMDEEVEIAVSALSEGKAVKTTQTSPTAMVNNCTQTEPDSHLEILGQILKKLNELDTNSNDMERRLCEKIEVLERKFSAGAHKPNTLCNESFLDDLYSFNDENSSTPQRQSRPPVASPRVQHRRIVTDLGFWKLTPSEILGIEIATVLQTASSKTPSSQPCLTPELTEKVKCESLNQRSVFARNLLYVLCTIEELYMKNVNGRVSHGSAKGRINKEKIDTIRHEVFKYFPCLPSEEKKVWAECVKVIDKANLYIFSVINKKFDISEINDYL